MSVWAFDLRLEVKQGIKLLLSFWADRSGADRVVFNIKGNAYRLVTAVDYGRAVVFIKWLGTHKEYDAIDVRTIQYAR